MNAKINRFERILKTRVKVRDDEQILLSFERREEERLMDLIENLGASRSRALDSFGEQGRNSSQPRTSGSEEKPSILSTTGSAGRGIPCQASGSPSRAPRRGCLRSTGK